MTIVLLSLLFLLIAAVLGAVLLSDALLQRLATALRGAPLEPRPLLTVRKVGYIVLIVYLFTWTLAWRRYVVDAAAAQLAVREQSRGDVHLTGSLVRLSLGGFRGVTTCYLWNLAMDKQMKNQLNELEVIVGWLTELQPHFNTPWLFQSWNLAYNVSNKTDRISDKYFYVSRGVRLLADGERQNHDDPDLRFELGSTYQHKICQSDETNVHRSLFQLSLIPPNERDPARFRAKPGSRQTIDVLEFLEFAKKHPQLVRRLREGVHKDTASEQRYEFTCSTPAAVVQFLADNYRVPSLYPEGRPTPPGEKWAENPNEKPDPDPLERYPVLPPYRERPSPSQHFFDPYDQFQAYDGSPGGDLTDVAPFKGLELDSWDGYVAARAWYSYSQEPIPDADELPGSTKDITDPVHQKKPRRMTTLIFRHYPARAQSYMAERLEEEGWYDDEGWSLKGPEWYPRDFFVGAGRKWAQDAWAEAYKMWDAHGRRNHLMLSPEDERQRKELAEKYWKDKRMPKGLPPGSEDSRDAAIRDEWQAARYMTDYELYRHVSNFASHLNRSFVEQNPETVTARKLFYQAQALASTGSTILALQKYQDPGAIPAWVAVLDKHKDYRHDDMTQEESYDIELNYLDVLARALPANELKARLGAAALAGSGATGWCDRLALLELALPGRFPSFRVAKGPFDREDADGAPWIRPDVIKRVMERRQHFQPRKKQTEEGDQPASAEAPEPHALPK